MKKIDLTYVLLLSLLFLNIFLSCKQGGIEKQESFSDTLKKAFEDTTIVKDTMLSKVSSLIESTKNSDTKIKDIKKLKTENITLKQELKETKEELEIVKEKLGDTIIVKKKKKGFIQKIVETIKKDTL